LFVSNKKKAQLNRAKKPFLAVFFQALAIKLNQRQSFVLKRTPFVNLGCIYFAT
jgi:hypothetical protein